jgi:hypothetical protein
MNFATFLAHNSSRATPSLRCTPKTHHYQEPTPAGIHLSSTRSCSDNRGHLLPQIPFGNDALQISNLQIGQGGLTLGNVQLYSGYDMYGNPIGPGSILWNSPYTNLSDFTIGAHEESHTLQAYILGPFFLPVWAATGGVWRPSPLETQADIHAAGGDAWPW